jgi:ribonuclease D
MDYVRNRRSLDTLCERLSGEPRLAVDTEFVGDNTYFPRLEIVQIAAPGVEAIVDYREASGGGANPRDLEPLWRLFAEEKPELVFHAASEDAKVLYRAMGRPPLCIFDTQLAMSFLDDRAQIGYSSMVEEVCGVPLDKGPQMLDWSRRPLPKEMVEYALNDVRYLLEIRDKLEARLREAGRYEWYVEEQEDQFDNRAWEVDPKESWRRVKKGGVMRGKALAVLAELAAWREREAMEQDISPQRVLPDDVISAVARLMPRTANELPLATRRLSPGHIRRFGQAMVEAVNRAIASGGRLELPPAPPPPPPHARALSSLLEALASARAGELGMALARLARTDDLMAIAENPINPRPTRVLRGWRREAIGEELLALARGEISMRWNAVTNQIAFERLATE